MAAGTIPISMTQQFDVLGKPLAGGQLYIIVAGTVSTPQDAFQDLALAIKQPYPMTLDAAGRVPQFFLDNSVNNTVKIRLQDKNGVVQLASDGVLIIGPAGGSGGSGGLSGETSQLFQTGDLKARYAVGTHPGTVPGWVRANNLTIGSATSGATERANADCQALFIHLYNADSTLAVSGGRTGNAANDWTSNKNIATPDWRGYGLAALDDMGNSAAGRYGGWFPNPTTLGSVGGQGGLALATTHLPPYTPTGTVSIANEGITINGISNVPTSSAFTGNNSGGGGGAFGVVSGGPANITASQSSSATFTGTPQGGVSTGFALSAPRKLCTIYLKL